MQLLIIAVDRLIGSAGYSLCNLGKGLILVLVDRMLRHQVLGFLLCISQLVRYKHHQADQTGQRTHQPDHSHTQRVFDTVAEIGKYPGQNRGKEGPASFSDDAFELRDVITPFGYAEGWIPRTAIFGINPLTGSLREPQDLTTGSLDQRS